MQINYFTKLPAWFMYSHIQERRKRIRPVKFDYRYMTIKDFGEIDNNRIRLYCIRNSRGSEVKITNYGSMLTSWITQDNLGNFTDVLSGFDNLQQCMHQQGYVLNNSDFKKARWNVEIAEDHSLLLHYEWSGYCNHQPVKTNVTRHYKYTDEDELIIEDKASSNNTAIPDLTNDFRFKLGDAISNHEIMINASRNCYVNVIGQDNKIATGVSFDLKGGRLISDITDEVNLRDGINYILRGKNVFSSPSATLTSYNTGRRLEIYTNHSSLFFSADNQSVCLKPNCTNKVLDQSCTFHSITKYKIVHF